MSLKIRAVCSVVVGVLLITSCGFHGQDASCLRSHGAKVCAKNDRGFASITASGLEPSSTLTLATTAVGPRSYEIGPDGTIQGAVGFVYASDPPPAVTVSGRAAGGGPIDGVINSAK